MFKHKFIILTVLLVLSTPLRALADDTDIYGTTSVSVPPNVMIIMDNSGSMKTKDVGGEPYDPATDYSLSPETGYSPVPRSAVYYKSGSSWYQFASDVSLICSTVRDELNTRGYTRNREYVRTNLHCGGNTRYYFRLGNFINYENSTLDAEYRYVVAQKAISRMLNNTTDKNFGIMHFNSSANGGYVKYQCGAQTNADIATYIDGMTAANFSTNTPLAETLAEAGLYFAGKSSWFNTGVSYTSPINYACQKNYVIIMTDGSPTSDDDPKLYTSDYIITGKKIATQDDASLLDDTALFLYDNDLSPQGDGTSLAKQNIITYTIGLRTNQTLLENTARNGGGQYFVADTVTSLDAALEAISNSINETNAVFLAPSVPVNRSARTAQSDWLYLAFFRPQTTGEWLGNIKKYALGKNGEVYGKDAASGNTDTSQNLIDEYGQIKDNGCSFWTTVCPDGNEATEGGIGERLALRTTDRNIYMLTGTSPNLNITDSANEFTTTNSAITTVDSATITAVRNFNANWPLGAIIHSEPAVVHYSNTQSVIFVGANDGMIHCFDDTSGDELWAFIPPGQENRLTAITDSDHDYYIDGSPSITYGALMTGTDLFAPKDLIIGERRGGDSYYVLDISSYSAPVYKYMIESDIFPSETLGQSWSKPSACIISTDTTNGGKDVDVNKEAEVFIIAGGYDTNQDLDAIVTPDTMGRAIISVNTSDGSLSKFTVANNTMSSMQNCIVDVKTDSTYQDSNGQLITTRVYAGDLGGKVFVFADDITYGSLNGNTIVMSETPSGDFSTRFCLFNAQGKKIFYAPQNSRMSNSRNEWVVFGTGNRENPSKTSVQNGIYAVRNDWFSHDLTESDLYDATENLIIEGADDTAKKDAAKSLATGKGWYVNFYDPGEKLTSSPIIVQDYIYFTTYVPSSTTPSASDPCSGTGALGVSYLWSIHLSTADPVHDYDDDGKREKPERRKQVAVMAQPTLIGADLISTPMSEDVPTNINFKYFFWRQQ